MLKKASQHKHHLHSPNRKYGIILFYVGLGLVLAAFFINSIYIKPTNFKEQFRKHQLADCLARGTDQATCREHFKPKN